MTAKPKLAVAYLRVSSAAQATEGVSMEAQQTRIARWCADEGYTLIAQFEDAGLSGKSMKRRPGLKQAMELACAEKATLVAYSMSRIARSIGDMIAIGEHLTAAGSGLATITEKIDTSTPTGRLMYHMMSAINQFEREILAERTALALATKRAKGESVGGRVPYGFSRVQAGTLPSGKPRMVLVPNAAERATMELAQRYHAEGWSIRAIGRLLVRKGHLPRQGTSWHPKLVKDLLAASERICHAA